MTITIELNNIKIKSILINYERLRVEVYYNITDSNLKTWKEGEAYFWVTIPSPLPIYDGSGQIIGSQPVPDNYFQLPASYIDMFVNLRNDADLAITAKVLS